MIKHYDSKIGISFMGIVYPIGGSTEKEGYKGTSHFMEHLMCKTFDNLRSDMRRCGITYNASTSNDKTIFWFEGLDEELIKYQQVLFDGIVHQKNLWTKEAFEAEKKTVIQEYKDCFNDQLQGTYYNILRKYYNSFGAIGLLKDIESFTYEDSLEVAKQYKTNYDIYQVGNKIFEKDINQTVKNYPKFIFNESGYDNPIDDVVKEEKIVMGMIGKESIDPIEVARISLLIKCITRGLESPLYQEIREKRGLSYYSMGWIDSIGNDHFPAFFSSTTNEKSDELKQVYIDFFNRSPDTIVSRDRFDVCMENIKIHEKKDRILIHDGINNIDMASFNPYEGLDTFNYDDCVELISKYFNNDKLYNVLY